MSPISLSSNVLSRPKLREIYLHTTMVSSLGEERAMWESWEERELCVLVWPALSSLQYTTKDRTDSLWRCTSAVAGKRLAVHHTQWGLRRDPQKGPLCNQSPVTWRPHGLGGREDVIQCWQQQQVGLGQSQNSDRQQATALRGRGRTGQHCRMTLATCVIT